MNCFFSWCWFQSANVLFFYYIEEKVVFSPVQDVLAYQCITNSGGKKTIINSPNKLVAVIVVDLTVLGENFNGGLKLIQFVLVCICGNIG